MVREVTRSDSDLANRHGSTDIVVRRVRLINWLTRIFLKLCDAPLIKSPLAQTDRNRYRNYHT